MQEMRPRASQDTSQRVAGPSTLTQLSHGPTRRPSNQACSSALRTSHSFECGTGNVYCVRSKSWDIISIWLSQSFNHLHKDNVYLDYLTAHLEESQAGMLYKILRSHWSFSELFPDRATKLAGGGHI